MGDHLLGSHRYKNRTNQPAQTLTFPAGADPVGYAAADVSAGVNKLIASDHLSGESWIRVARRFSALSSRRMGPTFGHTRQFGGLRDTDPLAVTDEAEEFVLASRMDALALFVRVTARLFANQSLQLATGKPHVITMTEGATLSGRVMKDGRPLPNVGVGVSAQDRAAGSYVGHFEVGIARRPMSEISQFDQPTGRPARLCWKTRKNFPQRHVCSSAASGRGVRARSSLVRTASLMCRAYRRKPFR